MGILLGISAIFAAGFLSGLLGIGGGVIFVPALVAFFKLGIHEAVKVSLIIIVPTALFGAVAHAGCDSLPYRVIFALVVVAVLGSFIGSKVCCMVPADILRKIFAVSMAVIAIRLFFK